jgi:protein-disulfide isomerase
VSSGQVPRIAAPLILAAAILLSFRLETPSRPIELVPVDPPTPSQDSTRAVLARALEPGAPGFDRGVTHSPVVVLEFADFGCPYCARFSEVSYAPLAAEFVTTGLVRWRYVPFALGIFGNDDEAARAGVCAGAQGRKAFDRMHDRLYAEQEAWKEAADAAAMFRSLAGTAGLDTARFASCYRSEDAARQARAGSALADALGVRATPTFFVNGRRIEGSLPPEEFRVLLTQALQGRVDP